MKIPQHLLRSFALGLGALSVTVLPGCKPEATAPSAPTGCCELEPQAPPMPASGPSATAPVESEPTDPCPPCGRG